MDLRQLRAVAAIADAGQFTRAAERLGIAQSSLSAQIRLLEQELGVTLFDRTTRRVTVTDAGELVLGTARRVMAEIDTANAELQRRRGLQGGRVAIGITPTPGPVDVVQLLADFHRQHPAIELSFREELSIVLAAQLRADEIDLALVTIVDPKDLHGLAAQALRTERLVLAIPPGRRLSERPRVAIAELRESSFIAFPPGATIRTTVTRAATEAGFEPHTAFETRDVRTMRALVSAGLGIAVLPRSDTAPPGPRVDVVELAGEPLVHTLSLCWREGRHQSPAVGALLEHARSSF